MTNHQISVSLAACLIAGMIGQPVYAQQQRQPASTAPTAPIDTIPATLPQYTRIGGQDAALAGGAAGGLPSSSVTLPSSGGGVGGGGGGSFAGPWTILSGAIPDTRGNKGWMARTSGASINLTIGAGGAWTLAGNGTTVSFATQAGVLPGLTSNPYIYQVTGTYVTNKETDPSTSGCGGVSSTGVFPAPAPQAAYESAIESCTGACGQSASTSGAWSPVPATLSLAATADYDTDTCTFPTLVKSTFTGNVLAKDTVTNVVTTFPISITVQAKSP